jgi:hypothetical protein
MAEDEQIADLMEEWYRKKGLDLSCAACGRKVWRTSLYFVAAPWIKFSGQPVEFEGGTMYTLFIPVFCEYCGFTVFFNADEIQALSSDAPDAPGSNEKRKHSLRLVLKEEAG